MMANFDVKALRNAFGTYPTGVTVVTTRDGDGVPVGFTANSFTSVSLDPPLLLVCPALSLSCYPVFENCRAFTVNVLAEGQEAVSNTFAGFKGDRFAEVDWFADVNNSPRLAEAAASFSCRLHRRESAGDHAILIGEVVDFDCSGAPALGYVGGRYFNLSLERQAASGQQPRGLNHVGAIIEHDGKVLLTEEEAGFGLPQFALEQPVGMRAALIEWLANLGFRLEVGDTYSIFEDAKKASHHTFFRAKACNANSCGIGHYRSIEEISQLQFASPAIQSMLERFAFEHQSRSFGLYLGDEHEGDLYHYHPGY